MASPHGLVTSIVMVIELLSKLPCFPVRMMLYIPTSTVLVDSTAKEGCDAVKVTKEGTETAVYTKAPQIGRNCRCKVSHVY